MSVGEIEQGKANAATWLDPKAGLEWQRESPGKMTWNEAQSYAQSLCRDGKADWRLPMEVATGADSTSMMKFHIRCRCSDFSN